MYSLGRMTFGNHITADGMVDSSGSAFFAYVCMHSDLTTISETIHSIKVTDRVEGVTGAAAGGGAAGGGGALGRGAGARELLPESSKNARHLLRAYILISTSQRGHEAR